MNARLAVRELADDDYVYSYVEPSSGDSVVLVSSGPLPGNGTYAAVTCVNNRVLCGDAQVSVTNYTDYTTTFLNPYPSYKGNRDYGYLEPVLTSPGTYDRVEGSVLDARLVVIGPAAVPEPSTWATLAAGFGVIGSRVRRRRGHVGRFA